MKKPNKYERGSIINEFLLSMDDLLYKRVHPQRGGMLSFEESLPLIKEAYETMDKKLKGGK